MSEEELKRKRKVARERIGEQYGPLIEATGCIVVDCEELGMAVVTPDSVGFNVRWLSYHRQFRTLAGRID